MIAISNIFVYCYFGQKVTTKFGQIANEAYASQWYNYPLNEQKALMLMMIRAQRPFYFTGYFISSCSLPTFKAVRAESIFFYFFYMGDGIVECI